jgi:hypothetical protein
LQTSKLFDAAFERRLAEADYETFVDLMVAFDERCCIDPQEPGEPHPTLEPPGRFWVYESPPISRIPRFAILYEIDREAGMVRLWNMHQLD